jgi:hypothetical protein
MSELSVRRGPYLRHHLQDNFLRRKNIMKSLPLVSCLLALAAFSSAAEGDAKETTTNPKPPEAAPETGKPGDAAGTMSKAEADALIAQGKQAMAESNNNPRLSVDAAIAFSKALKYYETSGDIDTVSDLEANIFWCKKRMNLDDIKSFLAQKSGDKAVVAALAKAEAVENKQVSADQAGEYFARAEKFAAKNPEKLDQISVRYFEVAKRFVGTEIGIKAQELSLAAQGSYMKQIEEKQKAARQTLFQKPTSVKGGIKQAPLPSAENQKKAISEIRSRYKADFAKKKPNQKKNLVDKLMEQAKATKDDPLMFYGLLESAITLAFENNDYYTVIDGCDRMAVAFEGVDAKAKKKAIFSKSSKPTVLALVKLMDTPDDAQSNTIAGKYFCFEADNWEIGLPLLVNGSDEDLQKLAKMEGMNPEGHVQQIELADGWYNIGKPGRGPAKEGPFARAQMWYQKAVTKITGITKGDVVKRMDEIDSALPMTNINYDKLTAKQWERLSGKIAEIAAAKDRNDISLRLAPGQRVRIVPHPTDTWTPSAGYFANRTVNAQGKPTQAQGHNHTITQYGDFPEGALVMQVENGKWMKPGIIEGEGRVFLGPYSSYGFAGGGTGVLRVKLLPADDE